jgi:DNA processing protein
MIKPEELKYWLALVRAPHINARHFAQILEHFSQLAELFSLKTKQLESLGFREETITHIQKTPWKIIDLELQWAEQANQHILCLQDDPCYPLLLKETIDPPPLLFVKGNPALLSEPQLAMVGGRKASPIGKELAFTFAKALALKDITITSGLALGIDAASHKGALAATQKTIAVLGTGLDIIYPREHQNLAQEISEKGALISEFPLQTPPKAKNFPQRNRIISGLSIGTLVIEAALKSGSLITARLAAEQGREVFAIPGSIYNPLVKGCHHLIQQGAKLVKDLEDIIEDLGSLIAMRHPQYLHAKTPNINPPIHVFKQNKLDETHCKLLECIGYEATSMDTLIDRTGLSVNEISSLLLLLELEDYIYATAGGYLRRR